MEHAKDRLITRKDLMIFLKLEVTETIVYEYSAIKLGISRNEERFKNLQISGNHQHS